MPSHELLDAALSDLTGVGPALKKKLERLGLATIRDLLFYYPSRYDDFSLIIKIDQLQIGVPATIQGRLEMIATRRARGRKLNITEAIISDNSDSIRVTWFNQPFLSKNLKVGDLLSISGEPSFFLNALQFSNPSCEKIKETTLHTGRLVPVYPTTEGLTQKQLRWVAKMASGRAKQLADWLPTEAIKQYNLISLSEAITQIHFPDNLAKLARAQTRLKFDELFILQLKNQYLRRQWQQFSAPMIKFEKEATQKFVGALPFKLTQDQRRTAWEILADLKQSRPMNRLLEGEVGSGKTLVAAIAILNAALNGYQSVIMAPTEILAQQHFQTFGQLFKDWGLEIALLTGASKISGGGTDDTGDGRGTKAKAGVTGGAVAGTVAKAAGAAQVLQNLASGKIKIAIGTHALLSEKVKFHNLALVIVDEQHRFGVNQRGQIPQQWLENSPANTYPHFLSMTATPIPRSLALTVFGDLDVSIIAELPAGRQKIITKIVTPEKREAAYDFVRAQIKAGRQAFVVCPLIDPSDKLGSKSVTAEYKKLTTEVFPDLKIAQLHGKIKSSDKVKILADFAVNKIQILVSTTVIEVGIDFPNATLMLVEGGERFGLAQLYQLRGRIGRGTAQSYCLVFADETADKSTERLNALVKAKNGFELAEKDLALRGPGEVFGQKQSGFLAELKIAKITDQELNQEARQAAQNFIEKDPSLARHPDLRVKIQDFLAKWIHWE